MANKEKNTKEEPYLLNDEELDEVEDVTREVPGKKYDIDYDPITGKFRSPKDFEEFKKKIEDMDPEDGGRLTIDDNAESAIIDTEPMAAESKKKRKINLSESEIEHYVKTEPVLTWSAAFSPAYDSGMALIENVRGNLTAFSHGLPIDLLIDFLKEIKVLET